MNIESRLEELNRLRQIGLQGGGKERIEKHHKGGHLTARERIDKLFDPGTFMEVGLLELSEIPGSGGQISPSPKISGFGKIGGRTVAVFAQDRTIAAGTEPAGGAGRGGGLTAYDFPEKGIPIIHLGDGGGVRLQEWMGSAHLAARSAERRVVMNLRKAPNIAAIMGDCFGGPTWHAATADFTVQVKGTCMAVSSPRVLEVALGEKVTAEELGGWKVHAEVTGQVDAFAENDEHCLQIIREYFSYMPSSCNEEPPYVPTADPPDRRVDEVMSILPEKANRVYDMYKIIKAIVDDGKYFDLKPYFGKAVITCLARMNGRVVGIIASQTMHNAGAAGPDECKKAIDFMVLCDSFNIPLIFLDDCPGNLVGARAEKRNIPTRIMVWWEALILATVPKISIIVRKAYGIAGRLQMGGPLYADFLAAWPSADISFMSREAALNVVYFRRLQQAEDPEAERKKLADLVKQWEQDSAPWGAAARGLVDDVIDPRDTRKYIITCLELAHAGGDGFISKKYLQRWPTGF